MPDTFTYVVQRGDTLYRIARRFGVRVQSLLHANPFIVDGDYILPGQILQIPVRPANLYVVQEKDSFYEIARRFNINLTDLLEANSHIDPLQLMVGQTIVLPMSKGFDIVQPREDYGYVEMNEDIDELIGRYPFIEKIYIGSSVMGKDIFALKIGTGPNELHYNGSFHANEWITTVLLMKMVEDYARAVQNGEMIRSYDATKLFNETTLWVVPMVNPDGVELVQEGITPQHPFYNLLLEWNNGSFQFQNWKANIRGVDLNDQFPAHWEVEKERRAVPGPGPRDYVGPYPLSEPEAQTMANFANDHPFKLVMAFHTQGEEIYWNYRGYEPPNAHELALRLQSVSGYEAIELTGSDAGYKDWFIQEFRRPGFTIEAGLGVNPLPITDFPSIYNNVLPLMLEGMVIATEL